MKEEDGMKVAKAADLRVACVLIVMAVLAASCTPQGTVDTTEATEGTTETTGGTTEATTETSASTEGAVPVPTIRFLYPNQAWDPIRTEIGQLVTTEWENLGLDVEGTPSDFDPMSSQLVSQPDSYEAFIYAFSGNPELIDPDLVLRQGFVCDAGSNYFGYCNETYDQLLLASSGEIDVETRREQIYEAQGIIHTDLPATALYHLEVLSAYNSAKFSSPTPYRAEGSWYWWAGQMTPLTEDRVLKIGQTFDIGSTNPFVDTGGGNVEYLKLMYDTLTRVTPEGETVPWAAESFEYTDPTTLEVKLRPGMTFSDGARVTAEDVAFSYDLFSSGEGYAAELSVFLEPLESVEVVDDSTVTFHLREPYAPFPTVTLSQVFVVPQHIWSEQVDSLLTFSNDQPVGSGQFRFGYWEPNQEVFLEANPDHFAAPEVDGLLGVTFGTTDAVFQALSTQEIDIHQASLQPSEYNDLATEDFMTVDTGDDIGVFYLGYNLNQPPFDDPQFRLALTYAIPNHVIIDTLFQGFAVTGSGFIAPANTLWHDPDLVPYTYDPDKARQILEDAGYTIVDGQLFMPQG
jgi:peptide/nickel transport system substrate-binding protein